MSWLDDAKVPSMIIGGVAASVLGQPRLTQDVDALAWLPESDWARVIAAAGRHGIEPRIDKAHEFARRSRVLLMRHVDSAIDIDLVFGSLSFEQVAIANSHVHEIGGLRVQLPRVEDLMIMKAIAGRPKDIQDIEALLAANPGADLEITRRWIKEFAVAMTMPDILAEFEKLVARRK